jgi:hypothetical protein
MEVPVMEVAGKAGVYNISTFEMSLLNEPCQTVPGAS